MDFVDPRGPPTVTPLVITILFTSGARPPFFKYRKTIQISTENGDHYWWGCWSGRVDHVNRLPIINMLHYLFIFYLFIKASYIWNFGCRSKTE